MSLSPNTDEAVKFLLKLKKGEPFINLVAINPEVRGQITGETISVNDLDDIADWLKRHNGKKKWNCYFTVNQVNEKINTKPKRENIKAMRRLHVDLDPGPVPEGRNPAEWVKEEREKILKTLTTDLPAGVPEPTAIIDSGGGYWGFWNLTDAVQINGEETKYNDCALYNKQLEILFGGDHCHNVDRIARIPGTVNYPDKRKREKKGRKPELANVVKWPDENRHMLLGFQKAPAKQSSSPSGGGRSRKVVISGNIQRVMDLSELPDNVPPVCKVIISQGKDPDNADKHPGRSEWAWYVVCELVRCQVPDDMIFSIITDPDWKVSEHVINQGAHYEDYATRQIERAHDYAVDEDLCTMNDNHAVIQDIGSGKCRVLLEVEDVFVDRNGTQTNRKRIAYQSFSDFTNFYTHKTKTITAGNGSVQIDLGKWWLRQSGRRSYSTVVFSPGAECPGAYNLWQGFAFSAKPSGSAEMFLKHIKNTICNGDPETYEYMLNWMAYAVQHPGRPGQVAVVLRGKQGTGKGTFAKHFGALWGRHYMQVTNSKHLMGNFNGHLADCVLLFADEAFAAGDKKQESVLKALITEELMITERKGHDAQLGSNHLHLVVASNEGWVVPTGADDRRFLVLDVSSNQKQNAEYFRMMGKAMKDGGYEALLHFLLYRDISDFNVYDRPETEALRSQKMYSFSPEEKWWYDKLIDGVIIDGSEKWPDEIPSIVLHRDFLEHVSSWNVRGDFSSIKFGFFLKRVLPGGIANTRLKGTHTYQSLSGEVVEVRRPRGYVLPTLETCRQRWDDEFGGPYPWPETVVSLKGEESEPEPSGNY